MSLEICCFRCGTSLRELTLPLSRRDQCPHCSADLHVCKMCCFYDRSVTRQCREDGADDVIEKERVNFCDWFKPSASAFDPEKKNQADAARDALADLFGEASRDDG
jgi:hypothetical protein